MVSFYESVGRWDILLFPHKGACILKEPTISSRLSLVNLTNSTYFGY
nr:MAG TPA: hypothetical protein [Crassvirales sp.]